MGSSDPLTLSPNQSIILFDGVCNLCNGAVQFIVHRDPKQKFRFASLQSSFAQQRLKKFGLDQYQLHSIILIRGNRFYERSNAVLEIVCELNGLWPAFKVFKIVPVYFRDAIYNLVAKKRYHFFGMRDQCMIPTPELRPRFIE